MVDPPISVLLVEDSSSDADMIEQQLGDSETAFELVHARELESALDELDGSAFDVILTDLGLPDSHGLDTLVTIRDAADGTPLVVLTGLEDQETALDALRMGARSYLIKSHIDSFALEHALRSAVEIEADDALRRVLARAREDRTHSTLRSLVGGMAKEIRAASSYLENTLARDAEDRADLGEAVDGVRRVARLASALQKLVERSSPEAVDVSLHEPVSATLYIFETFRPEALTVTADLDPTPPVVVEPIRFQQAFLDMLVKVADAIDGVGSIEVVTYAADDAAYARIVAESRDGDVDEPEDMVPVRDVVHDHGGKLGRKRESPAHLAIAVQLPLANVDDLEAQG